MAITQKEREPPSTTSTDAKDKENKDKEHYKDSLSSNHNNSSKDIKPKDDPRLKLNLSKGSFNSSELLTQQVDKQDKKHANVNVTQSNSNSVNVKDSKKSVNLSSVGSKELENLNLNSNLGTSKNPKEQKLNSLMNRKGMLRKVLQEYQQEFFNKTNRKIKFHKDILPVEKEY